MGEIRTRNSIRNITAGLLNQIIALLMPFVIRALIIQKLGVEYLGLNSLFSSILQVLSLTELGFGSAMVYSMYRPIAEGNTRLINALLGLYKKVYKYMGLGILCVGLLLIPFLKHLIASDYPDSVNLYIIYAIFLANTVISYFLYAYKSSLLIAIMRSDIDSIITGICNIAMYLLQAIILLFISNYYVYAVLIPAFTAINNIIRSKVIDLKYPEYKAIGNLSPEIVKGIKKRVVALAGHRLGGVIFSSADSIIISAFLGLVILGKYSNYFCVYTAINGMMSVVFQSIIAIIGNGIVTQPKEKNMTDFYHLFFINGWITGVCAICFLCLYQPFMRIWVGEENMLGISIPILLSIYYYFANIRKVETTFKDAAGMWSADFWKPYVSVIINITANIIFVNVIGLEGVIISSIVAIVCVEIPWEVYVLFHDYFICSYKKYYLNFIKITMAFLGSAVVAWFACIIFDEDITGIVIRAVICLVIPNIIAIVVFKNNDDYQFWKKKIKEIIKK